VLADAGYGNDTEFRDGVGQIGLPYVVGIMTVKYFSPKWQQKSGTTASITVRMALPACGRRLSSPISPLTKSALV
jgi:SRSO17 transposase